MLVDVANWITLIVAVLALLTSIVTAVLAGRQAQQQIALDRDLERKRDDDLARHEADRIMRRFREPLARAVYDVENTIFLLAQYFGWQELIREEIQFVVTDARRQSGGRHRDPPARSSPGSRRRS